MTYDAWISNFFSGLFARMKDTIEILGADKETPERENVQKKGMRNVFQSYKLRDKSGRFVIIGLQQGNLEERERRFSRAIDHGTLVSHVHNR